MSSMSTIITFLVIGLFIVTLCTDIITQVIKKITYDKIPTNIVCLIISLVLSIFMCIIGGIIGIYVVQWYHIVIAIIFAFFAAFIGMIGFDKLVQTIEQYKNILELLDLKKTATVNSEDHEPENCE